MRSTENRAHQPAIQSVADVFFHFQTMLFLFRAPVQHGIQDDTAFAQARSVLIPLGEYFQVQDDFLDCYGEPAVIGKIGTDIEDNKCSWMIVQALRRATPGQRKVLDANYGCKDAERVAKVKQVYDDLNLRKVFAEFEEESYRRIGGLIAQVDDAVVPREVFASFMKKIYKRTK
ncbi:MAG: isoprenoid synthase domain-containing protein [Olpidium bornovanus]|uniref:Isoprenoid synthase domain-containing protein n=1 Tax=Olpidium bornovanus TaxID=278681 RepID=A0A8H7ZQT9_9FUNG|nr:MAG: isoprenoid synthase domain-containing protein [Olpidium bornovanus]